MMSGPALPIRTQAPLWASGQIAAQIFRDLPSLLLLFYMTQLLGIPPAMAGAAIFIPKLFWAVLCDSVVGVLSDRWRLRFARRHFLLIGAVLVPVAMITLFNGDNSGSVEDKALHISLVLALYMLVFALFSVPHLAIGTEIAQTPSESALVMGWRVAFSAVGLLIGNSVAPLMIQYLGGTLEAYRQTAMLMSAVCSAALVVSWIGARDRAAAERPRPAAGGAWKAVMGNRALLTLFLILMLQLIASGMAYASLLYVFTYNLAFAEPLKTLGIFVLITAICAMSIQPVWVWLSKRLGKRIGLIVGAIGYASSLLSPMLITPGHETAVYVIGGAMGLFNSGCYLNIYALLSDLVEAQGKTTGDTRAGLYSGLFSAGDKIGFAIGGTLLTGLVLGAYGFAAGSPVQSADALGGIWIAYAVIPGCIVLVTALMAALMIKRPAPLVQMA